MQAVVSQPHMNEFIIEGTVAPETMDSLRKLFGESIRVIDDGPSRERDVEDDGGESVDFRDTEWYKETKKRLTPSYNLRFYRKLSRLSQKELAGMLGVSKQLVADMEHERRSITADTARELSRVFQVSVEKFV